MRSYGQYCALARSLDLVGDRWTLLIIRELFARNSRYSDLRDGLPGIATNLLADRLRQLQDDGLVEAYDAPPPVRATVYRLTPRGRDLGPVLRSLVGWGMPLLGEDRGDDEFRPQWLMLALRILYDGVNVEDIRPLNVVVETGHEPVIIAVDDGSIDLRVGGESSEPMVILEGDPHDIYTLLSGETDGRSKRRAKVRGPKDAVDRLNTLIERARVDPRDRSGW